MPYVIDPFTGEVGDTFLNLQNELYARGYDHLNQNAAGRARAKRYINQAHQELCLEELWPFRLATATGAAPLLIADLDRVLTVVDTANNRQRLFVASEEELSNADLTATGTPVYFYRSASLQVSTWPVGGTLSVRYFRVPNMLASDADTTLVPLRYSDAIVDGAVRRAAKDRDNPDAVALAEAERQRALTLMRAQLLEPPDHFIHEVGSALDD